MRRFVIHILGYLFLFALRGRLVASLSGLVLGASAGIAIGLATLPWSAPALAVFLGWICSGIAGALFPRPAVQNDQAEQADAEVGFPLDIFNFTVNDLDYVVVLLDNAIYWTTFADETGPGPKEIVADFKNGKLPAREIQVLVPLASIKRLEISDKHAGLRFEIKDGPHIKTESIGFVEAALRDKVIAHIEEMLDKSLRRVEGAISIRRAVFTPAIVLAIFYLLLTGVVALTAHSLSRPPGKPDWLGQQMIALGPTRIAIYGLIASLPLILWFLYRDFSPPRVTYLER